MKIKLLKQKLSNEYKLLEKTPVEQKKDTLHLKVLMAIYMGAAATADIISAPIAILATVIYSALK